MNNRELKRELVRLQTLVIALGSGLMMFVGATMLLLLDIVKAAGLDVGPAGDVFSITILAFVVFMFGCLYPSLMWAWDYWRDRQTAEGGAL